MITPAVLLAGTPEPPRPTWGSSRPAAVLLGLAVFALLSSLTPPYHLHASALLGALVLLPVIVGLFAEAVRRGTRTWVDPVAPWLTFVLIAVLRHGVGGADAQLALLVAFPIFWLALYGTRQDLLAGAVLAAVTLLAPLWLIGAPEYPASGWRPALIWTAVALFAAPLIQQSIQHRERQVAVADDRHRETATTLNGILYGATMVGLLTLDPEGRVLSASKGAESLCGRPAGELAGEPLLSVLCDHHRLASLAAELRVEPGFEVFVKLARLRAPGRVWACHRADGEQIAVRIAVTELRDEDAELLGYLCICVDETEAQQARLQLGEAEARWRILMDHLPDTTVVLVEEGRGIKVVTGAGAAANRLRDSAGRWLEDLARDARVPLDAMLTDAFAGREVDVPDAGTDRGDHEIQVSPLPPTSGRGLALVVVRDVSRDRRRERAITVAKERAERLFASAPHGIALLRTDGVVVQANPALAAIFDRADLEGMSLSALSYDEGDTTVLHHLETVLAGAGQTTAQWTVRRPDGEEVHVALSSIVLTGQRGEHDQVLTNVVDVSERHRYEQQLAHLADHDPLTGLANRRRFDMELDRHVEHCRRYGPNGALLVLDLDHFKEVNDTLGHAAGDELLMQVAGVLRARLRSTDVVARLGGDEFAVLLPHANRKAAERVAQSVVDEIRDAMAATGDNRRHVTVSVGGVLVESAEVTAGDLLSVADSAMYAAKSAGRNQYVLLLG